MGKRLGPRNHKHFMKIGSLGATLFIIAGLFSIYYFTTSVQSQTPATTPTSLRLAVKGFELSISGSDGTFKPVLAAPPVTGTSTGGNTNDSTVSPTVGTLNDSNQSFNGNQFINFLVQITSGTGAGQVRLITGNTTTLTVSPAWTTIPDNTSGYEIIPTFSGTSTGSNTNTPAPILNDTTQSFTVDQFANFLVEITGGTDAGDVRIIKNNTTTQLTVSPAWTTIPDSTSTYLIRPTVDVIHNIGSIFNAANLLFLQGTYLGVQIALPEYGVYSGPDPCAPGNTVNNVPIHLAGGSGGELDLTYVVTGAVLPPFNIPLSQPLQIGSNPVELRLVFIASNSVVCASDGITPQIETDTNPPVLISNDDTQSPLFNTFSLFNESLYTEYYYQGAVDKSQATNCTPFCATTGGTSNLNGYDFTWRIVATVPSLPFSNTNLVLNASLIPPTPLTLIGNINPNRTLNMGCNSLIEGQGPPLDLNINEFPSLCTPPHINLPVTAPSGLYNIPHLVNTAGAPTFVTSTFNFTSTPLLEPQFPRPVPIISVNNDPTRKFPIQRIDWTFSPTNPKPIIFSQQVQIFVNLPCDTTIGSCDIRQLNAGYTAIGGGLNTAVRSQIFPDPTHPQTPLPISTTLTADIAANDTTIPVTATTPSAGRSFAESGIIHIEYEDISYTGVASNSFTGATRGVNGTTAAAHANGTTVASDPLLTDITNTGIAIYLSDVSTIRFIIGDALGTSYIFDFQATGPDLVETNLQTSLQISTTLTANIAATDTTIPVASTTGFLPSGSLQIDNEAISYTGVTSNSFTGATRGVNGTTPASHLSGASVISYLQGTVHRGDAFSITDTIQDQGTDSTSVSTTATLNPGSSITQYTLISTTTPSNTTPIGTRIVPALGSTALSASIAATDTTIPVVSTSGFITPGSISIDNETISYTGLTSTSFTGVTRGVNSTTPASHLSGASVLGTDTEPVSVTVPSNTPTDTYSLQACADSTQLILESNEQNNCITAAGTLTVVP